MEINKINEQTIGIVKIISAKVETVEYTRKFLDEQKVRVAEDLANMITRHAKELAEAQANVDEVDALLLECDKLGIK